MEVNKLFINTFGIATFILIIYMFCYLINGKEKGIISFFKILFCNLKMYFASIIPIMLIISKSEMVIESNELVANCVIYIFIIMFSIPFFVELIKNIERDFGVYSDFSRKSINLLIESTMTIFAIVILIAFTAGFIAGDVSFKGVIGVLYMSVSIISILIVSGCKRKFAENDEMLEKIRKIERKIGIILTVFMLIFFPIVVFF